VPVYIIREESVYVVHNMKNILVIQIIGIFYSGSWKRSSLRPLFTPFIIFAPTTTQISFIKYFYVIDSRYICEFQSVLVDYFQKKSYYHSEISPLFTTFDLFKKYYNTHLQSKTFYILNILSLSVIKITKRNKFRRYLTS
jgi:hypothetical protein